MTDLKEHLTDVDLLGFGARAPSARTSSAKVGKPDLPTRAVSAKVGKPDQISARTVSAKVGKPSG